MALLSVSTISKGLRQVARIINRRAIVQPKMAKNPIIDFIKKSSSTTITLEELNKMAAENKLLKSSIVRK